MHDRSKPTLHPVTPHGEADCLVDNEPHPRRGSGIAKEGIDADRTRRAAATLPQSLAKVVGGAQSKGSGEHDVKAAANSGSKPVAAPAAAPGDDGAPGPRAHTQPKSVRLAAAAVVGLKGTLAHWLTAPIVSLATQRFADVDVSPGDRSCHGLVSTNAHVDRRGIVHAAAHSTGGSFGPGSIHGTWRHPLGQTAVRCSGRHVGALLQRDFAALPVDRRPATSWTKRHAGGTRRHQNFLRHNLWGTA